MDKRYLATLEEGEENAMQLQLGLLKEEEENKEIG